MKVIREGHRYELANFEGKALPGQTLQFIEKIPSGEPNAEPGALVTLFDGTTNEEVLAVLIDRCQSLYNKFPSEETKGAIEDMKAALYKLETRTRNRQARGVEGKALS